MTGRSPAPAEPTPDPDPDEPARSHSARPGGAATPPGRATAGDFLDQATDHLRQLRELPDPPARQAQLEVIAAALCQAMTVLARTAAELEAACSQLPAGHAGPWAVAAARAGRALRRGVQALERSGYAPAPWPGGGDPEQMTPPDVAAELLRLRLDAGLSAAQLARALGWTESRVIRAGTRGARLTPDEVAAWARATRAAPPARDLLMTEITAARDRQNARSQMAGEITGLARALTLTRDVLSTHVATGADGSRQAISPWAEAVASAAASRALAGELGACAGQLAAAAARIAQSGTARYGEIPRIRRRLAAAATSLSEAAAAISDAHATEPVTAQDAVLLRSIPVHALPARALPRGTESAADLAAGIASSAERTRHAAWQATMTPPDLPAAWLRHAATSAAAISSHCHTALAALPESARPDSPAAQARAAAGAAIQQWLDIARALGEQPVPGRPTASRAAEPAAEAAGLAAWTSLLAARAQPHRGPAAAPAAPWQVLAAASAASALTALAAASTASLQAAGQAGHLYVRTLPGAARHDPQRRYTRAPAERVYLLGRLCDGAAHASGVLAASLTAAEPAGASAQPPAAARPAAPHPALPRDPVQGPLVAALEQRGVTDRELLISAAELQYAAGLSAAGQSAGQA